MATKADLEGFRTSVTCPEDFDEFWSKALAQLAQEPLEATATLDPLRSNDEVRVYQATYRSLDGLEIFGWYSLPAAGDGPFPAILVLPGYKSEPALRRDWGRKGVAVLSVAVRGKLPSSARFNPGYPGLLTSGIESRDTYSYRGVISDCSRGVDFLLSRPEIDSNRIFCCGSSQGGGLTLATAGIRPEIKAGVSGYPFLCCYPESMQMFRSYPYDELSCYVRAHPEQEAQMLETLRYFDGVNFATRIKCPMVVGIALEDEVCPPETSFAAYDRLAGDRELWLFPESGHGNAHDYPKQETAWLEERIAASQPQWAVS
jgi:cephalosporin-C deacetylase